MIFLLVSLFFLWMIYRELTSKRFPPSKVYCAVLLALAIFFAWSPLHRWYFESVLTNVARQLTDNRPAKVHCNTLYDTLFDEDPGVAGHGSPLTGYIVIQYPGCDTFMDYLKHPGNASLKEVTMLNILTHESMHARGETNEAKTECQAVQRNYRTARLLGIIDPIARQNALDYYNQVYLKRSDGYFSKLCGPGKAWDEHLPDSSWNFLPSE